MFQQLVLKSQILKRKLRNENAVIMYVIGESPSISYLNTFLMKQCNIENKPEIFFHLDGYFVVRFSSLDERNRVLYTGLHTIASKPIIRKAWDSDFCFEKEVLKVIPLWI